MNVLTILVCCFVCGGKTGKPTTKQSRILKVFRAISNTASAAKHYMSRHQADLKDAKAMQFLFDKNKASNKSYICKLSDVIRAEWKGGSRSSKDESLMTVSLTSSLRSEHLENLSNTGVSASQESIADAEQLAKVIACWRKGGTFPVHLRVSILDECFGIMLLGR